MSRGDENRRKQHFAGWASQMGSGYGKDKRPKYHPLALYFQRFKTSKGQPIDYALIGTTKWVSVQVLSGHRVCRNLNQWQQDFCRKFEQMGGEGELTWAEIAGLALGTSTSLQRRGRRTAVQLTLPLIWKPQTRKRATPATQPTA